MNQHYGTMLGAVFAAGVTFLFILGVATHNDIRYMGGSFETDDSAADDSDSIDLTKDETATALLTVKDQMHGDTVIVERVELSESGWVVVHEVEGGHVLNALGARRVDAGVRDTVAVELLRNTVPGGSYAIILYTDNGNKEFEIRSDLPMIDAEGNPIMHTFKTFGGAAGR